MVVHHAAEALEVVVAEEAVEEGPALHQQLQPIPGQRHHRGEQQAGAGPQAAAQALEVALQHGEQPKGQAGEHHRHGPLGQHRQPQQQPAGPPGPGSGIAPPEQQQRRAQQGTEQRIADGHAAPQQHQRRKGEGQGGAGGGDRLQHPPRAGGAGCRLRPAQQGGRQQQHHAHTAEGGGQAGRPGAQGVPAGLAGQGVAEPHQPIDQRRLVVAGQAIDPGGQPVAGVGHGPGGGGEQRRRFIHQPGAAEAPDKQQQPHDQHCQQHQPADPRRQRRAGWAGVGVGGGDAAVGHGAKHQARPYRHWRSGP